MQGYAKIRMMLAAAGVLTVALALPTAGQAKTKFGAHLTNNDGSTEQPTTKRNCQQDANALDSTKKCDRIAVRYQDTGAVQGHIKAPRKGTLRRIKLVALNKGSFRLELGRAKSLNGSDGKGRIVRRNKTIHYKSSVDGNGYKIQTFRIKMKVKKGDLLAIRSNSTSMLQCTSGSTEQLLFQPLLPVGGPFVDNIGHRSNCTLLLQAIYK